MQELRHFAILTAGLVTLALPHASQAADTTKPPASCVVSGKTVLPPGATLFEQASGAEAVATLPGAAVTLQVRFPPGKSTLPKRIAVETIRPGGYLRISGWIDRSQVSFFAKKNIPFNKQGLALTQGMRVVPEATTQGTIRFRHAIIASPQKLSATTPCDALSLSPTVAKVVVPSRAKNYQMRKETIELFSGPAGKLSHRLELVGESRKVFWSDESKGAFIHVHSHGDITIDAWVKRNTVVRLRATELFDLAAVTPRLRSPRILNIKDAPKLVTNKKATPVYTLAGGKGKKIGTLEAGSRYYPMEQAHDWVNIYPDDLAVFPTTGFWIKPEK